VAMIAGNPNRGKRVITAVLTLMVMMILITVIISARKRTAPAKQPPLHPSTVTPR